jgi:hypothetical protein
MPTETFSIQDKSSKGNYYITGALFKGSSVGHSFCIGTKMVVFTADNFGGMLDEAAIEAAGKQGIGCAVSGCNYSHAEHKEETGLKVFCKKPMFKKENEAYPELHKFLLSLKKKYGKKYEGFAFVKEDGKTPAQDYA